MRRSVFSGEWGATQVGCLLGTLVVRAWTLRPLPVSGETVFALRLRSLSGVLGRLP